MNDAAAMRMRRKLLRHVENFGEWFAWCFSPAKQNSQGKNKIQAKGKTHAKKGVWGALRATLHGEMQNVSAS